MKMEHNGKTKFHKFVSLLIMGKVVNEFQKTNKSIFVFDERYYLCILFAFNTIDDKFSALNLYTK